MKKLCLLLIALSTAAWCSAVLVDFDSESDFSSTFNVIQEGAAGTTTYSSEAGVGGTAGRINTTGITTASGEGIYTKNQVDPDDGTFSASFYFLAAAYIDADISRIALGLSPDSANLRASSEVQARLMKNGDTSATFEIRDAGNGTVSGNTFTEVTTTGVTLADNHWYKFSATFSTYGSSSMEVTASLIDFGTDGLTQGLTIATAHGARSDPTDFGNTGLKVPLNIGILAQNDGGGAVAIDNIDIPAAAVPEPATLALFAVSGSLVLLVRRWTHA